MNTLAIFTFKINRFVVWLALLAVGGTCEAQSQTSQAGAGAESDYAIAQVGPHSRVWANSAGQTVTEIATGMNYWDGQQWTPSNPSFQVSPDGTSFVAAQIQDPTILAAQINSVGAVSVTTPENIKLSSSPVAIGLYDAASGKSVVLAAVTNSTGALVDAQDVVYQDALIGGGLSASIVYSLPDSGSFHQDVVFTGFDPDFDPTLLGFAAGASNTLQIQIFTEFYNPPQPLTVMNPLYIEQDPAKRASMASPDIIDYTLDFGHYVFGPGMIYTSAPNTTSNGGIRTAKDFVTSSGRTFLVESVPYLSIESALRSLPPVKISSLNKPKKAQKMRVAAASLPSLRDNKNATFDKIAVGKTSSVAVSKPHGLVADYVVTVSSTVEPKLYTSDTTYFVSGTVVESSAVTMEAAVFKYPTNNIGAIEIASTLSLATTNYRPAIFTAADDNTSGTTLSTSIWSSYSGNPNGKVYGNAALWLNSSGNYALNNLRFCYMNCGLEISDNTTGQSVSLSHAQMVKCVMGIDIVGQGVGSSSLTLTANNCLMSSVTYPIEASSLTLTGKAYNCTIDSGTDLLQVSSSGGSMVFTNSIFSTLSFLGTYPGVTLSGGYNGFYSSPAFGSSQTTNSSYPYQSSGAGNYYLPSTSAFLTNATSNVTASLLAQLEQKTVIGPAILTNAYTNNNTLSPYAQRDTSGIALGFHYDPIDWISALSISNGVLLLTNGVALAYYDNLGIWLLDNSQLVSQGTPNQRNYLVYYNMVQEQPTNLASTALAQALPIASEPVGSSANPSIYLRLTTISAPNGETNLLNTGDNGFTGQTVNSLTLQDCEIYGSGANWLMRETNNTPVVGLTNNVFYRVPFSVKSAATITTDNSLFYGTTNTNTVAISIQYKSGGTSANLHQNNVYDGVNATLDGTMYYNGYIHGATNLTSGYTSNHDIFTNLTWQGGPLGAYYQPANSAFLYSGSTYASNLGLFHYTVLTNESSTNYEGTNIVSRGYHYVALGTNGLPLDTNGDGEPDYLEDANGNGVVDSGEIDWLVAGDLGLTVIITQPANNSKIP